VVAYLPRGQELKARYAFHQLWETIHGDAEVVNVGETNIWRNY
jgi:hypothetical protein